MKSNNPLISAALSSLVLCLLASSTFADSLDRILSQHAKTLGSVDAWQQVQAISYDLSLVEPGFQVQGIYRANRQGQMRIDIYSEGTRVFTEAYDGKQAWQWQGGESKVRLIEGEAAAALLHGIELPGKLYTLLDMKARGHKLEHLGTDTVNGETMQTLKLTLKDGHIKYYFLHPVTGTLVAERDTRAFHPDLDKQKIQVETRHDAWRIVADARRSTRSTSVDLEKDSWLSTALISKIELNESLPASYFSPSALQDEQPTLSAKAYTMPGL